ncbi:AMP-binding protein [Streptomyces sp. NRRL B-1677]|uniref:class I adenylate-forming enzyme family protein n=1 Tax=Streptomyces sp. NRRL B-1677 TaxID=2682966 RepID=UPI001892C21C|nr:class I adenylate-forming enzyme family protein [Streptomyces sp. NRRL B-1677]MBF6045456.1 AMP-binding protein [Streptomyces sp. NRRL B-1677]
MNAQGGTAQESTVQGGTALHLGLIPERAAARHGDVTITLDHDLDALPGTGRRLTYAGLAGHVDDLAARLWAAGVRPTEHLAVHKAANFDTYLLTCAAARIGAVPVLLSPQLDGATAGALLRRLNRPHLLTDDDKLRTCLAPLALSEFASTVLTTGPARPGCTPLTALAGAPRRAPVLPHPDRPALMTHTSGTTGLPKLVVHTAESLYGRYAPQRTLAALIRTPETYAAHLSPVHSRMYLALAVALPKGMPLVIVGDPEPAHVADLFARTRPGFVETHPNSFMAWEELADDPRRPLASVRYFSATFDALHPPTVHRLLHASRRRAPLFFQFYGQSECGPLTGRWYTRRTAHRADGRCLGRPLPGVRVRLATPGGRRATRERPGAIEVRAAGRATGYHAEPERFAQQLHDGWWRTGDVGYRTRTGCLHLLDREVDVIPHIGSTLDVEDRLMARLPELAEVVLVPGPCKEPVPVVCTRGDAPLDPARWTAATADWPRLAAPVQLPLSALPRTATMKVRRLELARSLGSDRPSPSRP